jgi:hypothetical protein
MTGEEAVAIILKMVVENLTILGDRVTLLERKIRDADNKRWQERDGFDNEFGEQGKGIERGQG